MLKNIHLIFFSSVLLFMTSCWGNQHVEVIYKVGIFSDGTITLNGDTLDLKAIDVKFNETKNKSCEVWYYKQATPTPPPDDLIKNLLDVIIKYKPAISFSSKPDFSDIVNPLTGQSKPRK